MNRFNRIIQIHNDFYQEGGVNLCLFACLEHPFIG